MEGEIKSLKATSSDPMTSSSEDVVSTLITGSEVLKSGNSPNSNSLLDLNSSDDDHPRQCRRKRRGRAPRTVLCITLLILLFISSMVLVAFGTFMHIEAFREDLEWNDILENGKKFPNTVKGDTYFKGKKFDEIPFFGPEVVTPEFKMLLHRNQHLEYVTLAFNGLFLIFAFIHFIGFVVSKTFRLKLNITYLGYGLAGVFIFAGSLLLLISDLIVINEGFLSVRIQLEDNRTEFGHGSNSNAHHDSKFRVDAHGHKEADPMNCFVDGEYENQLLAVCKICAYRHTELNFKDPCKPSLVVPVHELILNNRSYGSKELEKLRICPSDDPKLFAVYLTISGAFVCWLVMWLGSNAVHELLEPHFLNGALVWTPRAVTGIAGWTPRTCVPSYMEIELNMQSPDGDLPADMTNSRVTIPEIVFDNSPTASSQDIKLQGEAGKNLPKKSVGSMHGGELSVEPSQRLHPPSRIHSPSIISLYTNAPNRMNLMSIIPSMVIRPPPLQNWIRAARLRNRTPEEEKEDDKPGRSWFEYE